MCMGDDAVRECRRITKERGLPTYGPEDWPADALDSSIPTRCGRATISVVRLAELRAKHTIEDLRVAATALGVIADNRAERFQLRLPETPLSCQILDCLRGEQPRVAMLAVLVYDEGDWPPLGTLTDAVDRLQQTMTHRSLSMRLRQTAFRLRGLVANETAATGINTA